MVPRGWFINGVLILLSGSAGAMPRQRESPRATFPFTINTLLCRAAPMRGWRTRRAPAFTTKRPSARRFSVRLWSKPAVRGAPRPSTCRAFSLVKLGSYPAWSLRGLEITPTDVGWICPSARCVQGIAIAIAIAIDRSEKERRMSTERGTPRSAPARELPDENSSPSPFRPRLRLRVCVRPPTETATHRLRGSDYFSRLTKCLVLSREISDPTLREGRWPCRRTSLRYVPGCTPSWAPSPFSTTELLAKLSGTGDPIEGWRVLRVHRRLILLICSDPESVRTTSLFYF